MKALRIDKTIMVYYNNKPYSKEFKNHEEVLEVYDFLVNANEDSPEDMDKFKKYFQRDLSSAEKQLQIEFEEKKEIAKKQQDILDLMKNIRDNGHEIFEVKDNSIYLKEVNISMPELLVREIIKTLDEVEELELNSVYDHPRFNALLNFWYLCAMNPDPRARHDLFGFLQNHNLTLTPSGNFVAYRTVNVYETGNEELEKFVTQEWLKIKRWKKAPINYYVFQIEGGDYVCLHGDKEAPENEISDVGNLDELYQNIGEVSGNVYTDAHTGTFKIKIGEPVTMNRSKVDADNTNACSAGLHLGNLGFMKNNMGYFGKVGIVCLVNPKNVTSVPTYDQGKMRTCEYLPVAIAELDDNGNIKDVDIDVFDYEMAQNTAEELETIKNMSTTEFEEYKKNEFISIEMDFDSLSFIKDQTNITMEEAKEIIDTRVVKI